MSTFQRALKKPTAHLCTTTKYIFLNPFCLVFIPPTASAMTVFGYAMMLAAALQLGMFIMTMTLRRTSVVSMVISGIIVVCRHEAKLGSELAVPYVLILERNMK